MFCPRCGSSQPDELKFCKACGANLYAVRQVVDTRETQGKIDWNKTWVAEMFMSSEEAERRRLEIEHHRGITPAIRRYQEIKAGVITTSAGISLAIFLHFLMHGIIDSGKVSAAAVQILGNIWIVGIIPLLVGIALIVNGWLVSKKIVELAEKQNRMDALDSGEPRLMRSPDTTEFGTPNFSVTEGTTKHLNSSREN